MGSKRQHSRILTSHHLGGNGDAEDITDDCIDADIVGNTRLQIRDGDAAPVPGHPLLELGSPGHGGLVRDHKLGGGPGAVPSQLDGAVADPRHPQVFRRRHWWEGQRYRERQGVRGLFSTPVGGCVGLLVGHGHGLGLCAVCGCVNSYNKVKAQEDLLHYGFGPHVGKNLTSFLLTSQSFVHDVFGDRDNREVTTLWGLSVS